MTNQTRYPDLLLTFRGTLKDQCLLIVRKMSLDRCPDDEDTLRHCLERLGVVDKL
jgi:hypothetical protein